MTGRVGEAGGLAGGVAGGLAGVGSCCILGSFDGAAGAAGGAVGGAVGGSAAMSAFAIWFAAGAGASLDPHAPSSKPELTNIQCTRLVIAMILLEGGTDELFTFKGTSANKVEGDLTFKVYDSVNGAEKALGFDIDGITGPSSYTGPVTVVFGDVDGGGADFAIALLNTRGVVESDFLLLEAEPVIAAASSNNYASATADYFI